MDAAPATLPPVSDSSRQLWRFGLISGVCLLLWVIGSAYGLGIQSPVDTLLCNQLAAGSAWLMRLLGWQAEVAPGSGSLLLLDGQPSVIVGAPCDGLVLYALLAGFVLAYPGPAQRRLWFIPLGIAALWLLNVVRIIALTLNHRYSPATFDFNHHYVFSAVAYAALGGMWLLWTKQGARPITAPEATLPVEISQPLAISQPRQPWLTTRTGTGLALLVVLALVNAYQDKIINLLSTGWTALLANGPAGLHQLPGATVNDVTGGVSHFPLFIGATYMGAFMLLSLLVLWLLLPPRGWRIAWSCYLGLLLLSVGLLLVGRLGAGATAYRVSRMVIDLLVSLLPVVALLVLLWRRPAAVAVPVVEPELATTQ